MWKALVLAVLLPQMTQAKPARDLSVPLGPVAAYDQLRLVGDWFEVALTPTFMRQNCHGTTAAVTPREDRRLIVKIACHKGALSGPVLPLEGVLVETGPGQFRLRIFRLADMGDLSLVLLWQAADDSMVVLGSPLGDVGWIWARSPHPDPGALEQAKAALVAAGYRARAIRPVEHAP